MSRKVNVSVKARECRNNSEKMIRKFNKKVKKERIIEQVKDRRRYKKPSVLKKEKRMRAQRARQREQLKNKEHKKGVIEEISDYLYYVHY